MADASPRLQPVQRLQQALQANPSLPIQRRSMENQLALEQLARNYADHPLALMEPAKKGIKGIDDLFFVYDAVEDLRHSGHGSGNASFVDLEPGLALTQVELHAGGGVHKLAYIGVKTSKETIKIVYGKEDALDKAGQRNVRYYFVDDPCPFGAKQVDNMEREKRVESMLHARTFQ